MRSKAMCLRPTCTSCSGKKPKALGIAVPGMPVGSPGMDGPEYGGRKDPYEVLLITKNLMNSDVSTRTFTSYR